MFMASPQRIPLSMELRKNEKEPSRNRYPDPEAGMELAFMKNVKG